MIRMTLVAAFLAAALPASALTQLQQLAQDDLRAYGFRNVDVTTLSPAQLGTIRAIAHQPGPEGGKRALIQSTLGGRYTLRGLLGVGG